MCVCVCVNPSLDASKACGLNAARQRATSYGSDSNAGGKTSARGLERRGSIHGTVVEPTGPPGSGSFPLVSTTPALSGRLCLLTQSTEPSC